jgi:hypothetical protein
MTIECCICKKTKTEPGYGNNPAPIFYTKDTDVCCSDCDRNIVIPTRRLLHKWNIDYSTFCCSQSTSGVIVVSAPLK